MKKNFFLLLFFFCSIFIEKEISAQITFQKNFENFLIYRGQGEGYVFQQTQDSGFIISANWIGPVPSPAPILIKMDMNGNVLWNKTFSMNSIALDGIRQTFDGGFITGGLDYSIYDICLIKTDSAGNVNWYKKYDLGGEEFTNSFRQTVDSGYIVVGATKYVGIDYKIFLMKTDVNGTLLWIKIIDGPGTEEAYSVEQTADSGYIILGFTYNTDHNVYLVKTDISGDIEWARTYGNSMGYAVKQTRDLGYIISGLTEGNSGFFNFYLIKTDSNGDTLWTRTIGAAGANGRSVQQTDDGGYILTGAAAGVGASADACLIKIDSIGNLLWSKTFGDNSEEIAYYVQQTNDKGFIIGGGSFNSSTFSNNIFFIKTDSMGNGICNQPSSPLTIGPKTTLLTIPVTTDSSIIASETTLVPSLGNFGLNVVSNCFSVGILETPFDQSIQILPNPSAGKFLLVGDPATLNEIKIYNYLGEVIFQSIISNLRTEIDLTNLPSGIYYIQCGLENVYATKKIIIQKL